MATEIVFDMQRFNGTDYDTLLPNSNDARTLGGQSLQDIYSNVSTTYAATIGTNWVEDDTTGVKTQQVAIEGITQDKTAIIDHVFNGTNTSEDYATFVEEENQYLTYITNGFAETYDGGITFTIFGDPNTIPIHVIVEA